MASSMAIASRSFQLCPLSAERYSAADMPGVRLFLGLMTDRPYCTQRASDACRIRWMLSLSEWYFRPSSALTELMIRWEWRWSRSVWVQTSTSNPANS